MIVIDASAAAECLLRTEAGATVAGLLRNDEAAAPELIDAEVLAVMRRGVLRREIDERRATEALVDLRSMPIQRISHRRLLTQAWVHRHNVSAYDAFYVAAAQVLGASLVTSDGPLSRAPNLGIVVVTIGA